METKIKDGRKYVKTRDGTWVLANKPHPWDFRNYVASEGKEGKEAIAKAKREKARFGTERFTKNKTNVPKADASRFNRNTKSNKGAFGGGSYGDYVKSDKTKTKTNSSFKEGLKINKKQEDGSSLSSTKEKKNKPDELASLKKKLKRHASGKNSVAKSKLKLKIRKLEGKK